MKWSDEDIDHLFQQANENFQPVFDEAFWDEVEKTLPQKNKKYRGFFYFMWTFVAVTTAYGAYLWLNPSKTIASDLRFATNTEIEKPLIETVEIAPENNMVDFSTASEVLKTTGDVLNTEAYQVVQRQNNGSSSANIAQQSNKPTNAGNHLNLNPNEHQHLAALLTNNTVADLLEPSNKLQLNEITSDENADKLNTENAEIIESQVAELQTIANENTALNAINLSTLERRKLIHWSVMAGAGISQSYFSDQAQNVLPTIALGLHAKYAFNRLGVSAGLTVANVFAKNLTTSNYSRVYGFTKMEYEQAFNYRQLTFIEIPLVVDYSFKNHFVSFGIAPTFLATSWLKYEETVNDKLLNEDSYVGQNYGLNKFGLRPMLGYEYMMPLNWSVGMQVSTQLFQQFDQTRFNDLNTTKTPISVMFTLRKTF